MTELVNETINEFLDEFLKYRNLFIIDNKLTQFGAIVLICLSWLYLSWYFSLDYGQVNTKK